jgi:hypothetical protein
MFRKLLLTLILLAAVTATPTDAVARNDEAPQAPRSGF